MIGTAYGMGAPAGGGGPGGFGQFLPIILIFIVFYFLILFPQQRKQKRHAEMLKGLQKGNRVVTSGGLHGVITGIKEDIVTIEIAKKVNVEIEKSSITATREKGP